MDLGSLVLKEIIAYSKYAGYIAPLERRETVDENITKNMAMHLMRFPHMKNEIDQAYAMVREGRLLPSMRSLQFGGTPIVKHNAKLYNCAACPIDDTYAIAEAMYLLLCGVGFGYSVRRRHTDQLPPICRPTESREVFVKDSIEGWADAVLDVLNAYTINTPRPIFRYDDIRPKGTRLSSGVIAPGPAKLQVCLESIDDLLSKAEVGKPLRPIQVHDILCHVANCVVSGGVRRSAMIALFDWHDVEMLECKVGDWWETNPQRGRANNSAALNKTWAEDELRLRFNFVAEYTKRALLSGSGDPGIVFVNHDDYAYNPCGEALLRNNFCNLVELLGHKIHTQQEFNEVSVAGSILGTMQATVNDFKYLRPIWGERTKKEALLGVGITGMVEGSALDLNMMEAAHHVRDTNAELAPRLGINRAHRTTVIKPSGTSTLYAGLHGSGVHDAPSKGPYLRRIRIGKGEALYHWLMLNVPNLMEDEAFDPDNTAVLTIPRHINVGEIRHWAATPIDFLGRVKHVYDNWIIGGHNEGPNGSTHNVSATVYLSPEEHDEVFEWLWENRTHYQGMSLLPKSEPNYPQLPIEPCDAETFEKLAQHLRPFDPRQVYEPEDGTSFASTGACVGGACEVN